MTSKRPSFSLDTLLATAFCRALLAVTICAGLVAGASPGADVKDLPQNQQAEIADADAHETLEQLKKDADRCRTAAEAAGLFKRFLARPELTPQDRVAAQESCDKYEQLDKRGAVRVGNAWVEDFDAKSKRAKALIADGITLLRVHQFKRAQDKFIHASNTKADSGDAEMWLGFIECFWDNDPLAAMRHFREAAIRSPTNFVASNNAAVAGFFAGRTVQMRADFRSAVERAGRDDAQTIADNMAKVIYSKRVNTTHAEQLNELYVRALRGRQLKKFQAAERGEEPSSAPRYLVPRGWDDQFEEDEERADQGVPVDETVCASSGTGFVVGTEFVITNHHVIDKAIDVAVKDPENEDAFLTAKVVASDAGVDLALLRVPGLKSPALRLQRTLPGRGTELMCLGYPGGLDSPLGGGIKSTKGSVIAMQGSSKSLFLHDALVDHGNSGGPLVDRSGSVVGVLKGGQRHKASLYFTAISVDALRDFITASGANVDLLPGGNVGLLEWPQVDAAVSKSTLYIECTCKSSTEGD
jgi:S1-C subfamily serine protease